MIDRKVIGIGCVMKSIQLQTLFAELNEMQGQLKQLSTHVLPLKKENEELKEKMKKAFKDASLGRQQFRVRQDDAYNDELGDYNLDD
ncbi:hypothetical protein LguiB_017078 [Lonicera macranthoides]